MLWRTCWNRWSARAVSVSSVHVCLDDSTAVQQSCLSSAFAEVLHLLFDVLFDEGIIQEDTFHERKGAAEQSGRDLVLQPATGGRSSFSTASAVSGDN